MKKTNHIQEISETRRIGFGGSDAAMVVAIAGRLKNNEPLTTTQKRRVRIIKGLESPRPDFTSEAIEQGRAFEDEVASALAKDVANWNRETFLTSRDSTPLHFEVFAHADFCDLGAMAVKEVKWTDTYTLEELEEIYRWQLQWYYMLGAESVSLVYRLPDGVTGCKDIARDEGAVRTLVDAWREIDVQWNSIDTDITEFGEEDTAPSVLAAIRTLHRLTAEKQRLDEEIAAIKEELAEAFRVNNATRFHGEYGSITMVPASETLQLDTRKLVKDYPDLVASYRTKIVRKPEYISCRFK